MLKEDRINIHTKQPKKEKRYETGKHRREFCAYGEMLWKIKELCMCWHQGHIMR